MRPSVYNDKSMDWKPYKNSQGEYAEHHGLVLTAWPTGAWSVHDPMGKVSPRTSELLFRAVDGGIEAGKKLAEEAALAMTAPRNEQLPVNKQETTLNTH